MISPVLVGIKILPVFHVVLRGTAEPLPLTDALDGDIIFYELDEEDYIIETKRKELTYDFTR